MDISIIVAVYNGENYIKDCLDSVKLCPLSNMECIIVNDGSSDNTQSLCEKYTKDDSRFKLINKQNSGVSDTRNIGIKEACGKYIFILDADDYLAPNAWNLITPYVIKGDYNMIAFSYYTLFDNGKMQEEAFPLFRNKTESLDITKEIILTTPFLNTCWGKLLKRSVIQGNSIKFNKSLKTGEDAVFIIDFVQQAEKKILLINEPILYYRQHSKSAMHLIDINRKLSDLDVLFKHRKNYCKIHGNESLERKMYNHLFSVLTNLLLTYTKNKNLNEIRQNYKIIINSELVSLIVNGVYKNGLKPFYKKTEYFLIKNELITILAMYFKLKNRFN